MGLRKKRGGPAENEFRLTAEELRAKVSQFKLPRLGGDPETL